MQIEKELKENGFTDKELRRLREILLRKHNNDRTMSSLIIDLSKRFWGGVICSVVIVLISVLSYIGDEPKSVFIYIPVMLISLIAIYFITPMKLAWKARKFIASKR